MYLSISKILSAVRAADTGISRSIAVMLVVCLSCVAALAQKAVYPERPNLRDAGNYISDEEHYLPPSAVAQINRMIGDMRAKTTCEMAICVVKTTGDESIEDYSYHLFKKWGIGKADKDNGVLIVIAPGDHRSRIEVGSGAEGVLTDAACANIIRHDIRPAMVAGENIGQALNAATESIYAAMTDPQYAEELRSEQGETMGTTIRTLNSRVIWQFILMVVIIVFFITMGIFIVDVRNTRKKDKYHRALIWRHHLSTYGWSLVLSLGATVPFALLAYLLYKRARNSAETCSTCGGKMRKLSEEEDNELLSPSQDFEEQIGTIDYDVWECPDCGTIERFPFVQKQTRYTQCPKCGTVAMRLICDKIIERPTTKREGVGVRTYECEFCQHRHEQHYRIPRKPDDDGTGALLAGAVIGSMLGGGRSGGFGGGGGISGGSFGGGGSSGGGASGSW